METLLRIGLSNTVVAFFMALVVATVACLWRRPAVLHALWLLVLIKLVTPPLVWVRVPWPIMPDAPAVAVAPTVEPVTVEPLPEEDAVLVPDSAAPIETEAVESGDVERASRVSGGSLEARTPPAYAGGSLVYTGGSQSVYVACALWLAGALAWYALALIRLRRFRGLLRHAIPAPESLRQRTQRLAEKLRLRRCPGVWLVPGRVAPMLWAAGGRPRILFPADLLKQVGVEQQNALLVHELAHLRRRDHWVRWLEFIAAGLYWWNPVLWFARRELREAEEQCCDAWVTSTLPGAGKTYATALLETLDFLSDAPPAMPLLASGVGRVVDLKRRLTMIMRGTTPRTLGWRGAAAVVGLGALLLPMLPAWVQAQPASKTEAKTEVKVEDPAATADLEKARAELKTLEAVLEQRKAEVAEAAARVEAARARLARDEAATKAADGEGASKRHLIMIAIDTTNLARMKDLAEELQRIRAGSGEEYVVMDQATGRLIMRAGGAKDGVDLPPPPVGTRWIGPGDPGYHPGQPPLVIAATETDKRIIDLEMKLKSLLSEVEKLRQERKPESPKAIDGESKPHSYGPTPLEKIPYVSQLFKQVGPAAASEDQEKMVKALKAKAETDAARNDRLVEELQDIKAKASDVAKRDEREINNAKLVVVQAEKDLQLYEKNLADAKAKADAGATTQAALDAARADLDNMKVNVEHAKAELAWHIHLANVRQAYLERQTAARIAELKSAGETPKELQEKTNNIKSDPRNGGDAPVKP